MENKIGKVVGFLYLLLGFSYLSSLSALSPQRGSFPAFLQFPAGAAFQLSCRSVPAFSPRGDNCATCTKQDDPRLILCAEGEIDFYAQVKGDRLQFHKARFGEANCINVLQKGEDRKVHE